MTKDIFILLCICLFPNICVAQIDESDVIMRLYHDAVYENKVPENALAQLVQIDENKVENMADSIQYQFHYMYAGLLNDTEPIDTMLLASHMGKAIWLLENKLGIIDIEYVELKRNLGSLYNDMGEIDEAISCIQSSLVRGENLLRGNVNPRIRAEKAQCYLYLGDLYKKKHYNNLTVQCYKTAHEIGKDDYDENDPMTMMPLFSLGCYYFQTGQDSLSVETFKELLGFQNTKGTTSGYYYDSFCYQYACQLAKIGRKADAALVYEETIARIRKRAGLFSDELESDYGNYIILLAEIGDFQKMNEYKAILKDYYEHKGNPQEYLNVLYSLSVRFKPDTQSKYIAEIQQEMSSIPISEQIHIVYNLASKTDLDNAVCIRLLESMLSSAKELSAKNKDKTYLAFVELLAIRYGIAGETQNAIRANKDILSLYELLGETSNDSYEYALNRLANLYLESKNWMSVLQIEQQREHLLLPKYGNKSVVYYKHCTNRGIALMYTDDYEEALDVFSKTAAGIKSTVGENSLDYAISIHNIGRCYMLKGNKKKALDYLQRSADLQIESSGIIDEKTSLYINQLQAEL